MTRLATTWLVYHPTHSVLLGIVSFSRQIVSFALGPFAGVWVERLNRRKLLVGTPGRRRHPILSLAVLTLTHAITLWEIIALTALQGFINAFDMPGRQSFLVQMVDDRNDLSNAIAINSSTANGTRLIGPVIAGMLTGAVGEGRGTALMAEWSEFRGSNPQARLVCVDVQPNATTQATERADILNIGGFSDQVFEVISAFASGQLEADHWIARIEAPTA